MLLLLSYTAPYISPSLFWPTAFLGLLFPILFITNLFFLILWLFKLKKLIWPNVIVLAIGLAFVDSYIGFSIPKKALKHDMSIMSYNVRLFNKNQNIPEPMIKEKIIDLIVKQDPDIICFQEFYNSDISKLNKNYLYKNHRKELVTFNI